MLSAGNALAPGPQLKHTGNVNPAAGGTPGRAGGLPEGNFFSRPLFPTLISNWDQVGFPMAPEKRDGMRRNAERIRYLLFILGSSIFNVK